MLWDEEAIKRRWSKSSRNKKKKKKLSLHDQQLPPRTRTRRACPQPERVSSPHHSKKTTPQCSTPALTETKTKTTQQQLHTDVFVSVRIDWLCGNTNFVVIGCEP